MEVSRQPAVNGVDECLQSDAVVKRQRVTDSMKRALIELWQAIQQFECALVETERLAAEQGECAGHAPLRRVCRLSQRSIATVQSGSLSRCLNHILRRQRPQWKFPATGLDGGEHARRSVAEQQEQRSRLAVLREF